MKLKFYFFAILFISLCSCEDNINIDFPEAEENLVLNSLIRNGDSIKVNLGKTISYTDLSQPPSVGTGKLDLYKDGLWHSTGFVCQKVKSDDAYKDTTYTFCFNHIAQEKSHYRIVASSDGFDPIMGSTNTASSAKIENWLLSNSSSFSFDIVDNGNENNYYFFTVTRTDTFGQQEDELVTLQTQDLILELIGSADEVVNLPSGESIGTIGFVEDISFNGKRKSIVLTGFFFNNGILKLNFYSCSESYYQFYRTSFRSQFLTNNILFSQSEVYSNVSNGYGLVGSVWDTVIEIPR